MSQSITARTKGGGDEVSKSVDSTAAGVAMASLKGAALRRKGTGDSPEVFAVTPRSSALMSISAGVGELPQPPKAPANDDGSSQV